MPFTVKDFDTIVGKLRMSTRDTTHRQAWFHYNGKKILFTQRSLGRGDLGRVENAIKRQLRVSSQQFRDLANCPMTLDAYVTHLKAIGAIEEEKEK